MNEFRDDPRKMDRLVSGGGGNLSAVPELVETVAKMPELAPGLEKLINIGTRLSFSFEPGQVSEFNKQLGEFALKMEKLQRLIGGGVKPEVKSFEDQIAAQIETNKKWTEAMDPVNKQLSDMQVKANAAKKAITDLGNSDALSSALLSTIAGGPIVASKDAKGKLIARGQGSLIFDQNWKAEGLRLKIEKEIEEWEKGVAKTKALFESIQGPVTEFNRAQSLMNGWLAKGAISLNQYNEKLKGLYDGLSDASKLRVSVNLWDEGPFNPPDTVVDKINAVAAAWKRLVEAYNSGADLTRAGAAMGRDGVDARGFAGSPSDRFDRFGAGIGVGEADAREWERFQSDQLKDSESVFAANQNFEKSLERQIELTKKLAKEQQRSADIMRTAFESLGNSITEYALGGEMSFKKMVDSMMKDLTRLIIKQMIAAALSAALSGPGGAQAASFAMNIGSGMAPGQAGGMGTGAGTGSSGATPSGYATGGSFVVPRAATGASYMIRGHGGLDSVPFPLAMVSPGEQVDVHPRARSGRNDNAAPTRNITIQLNDRDEAEVEDLVLRVIHRNPAAIRGAVTGR
jgi:hypothetical protein